MTATLARWPRAFTGLVRQLSVSGGPSVAGVRCGCGLARGAGRPGHRVAGVGVTPAQVVLEPPGQDGMVRVVRAAHDKGAQGPELRLDRIGPRRARGREAQLDVLPPGPAAD